MLFTVFESLCKHSLGDILFEHCCDRFNNIFKSNVFLFTVVTCADNALVVLDILGSELDSYRNALHFVFGELPAGRVVAVIDLYSYACGFELLSDLICHIKNALFVLLDRNDNCLNGCNCRGKNKSAVVAVGHDNCTDKTCCNAP